MNQRIAHIALVVNDYDEAIAFYTSKLGFTLMEDTVLSETKRWVLVAPHPPTRGYASCVLFRTVLGSKTKELYFHTMSTRYKTWSGQLYYATSHGTEKQILTHYL